MIEKTIFEITGELIENYNILDVLSENEVKKLNKIIDTCKDDIEIDSTQFEISFNILDSIENDIEKLKIEYRNSNVKVMIEMIEKIHFKYFQIVDLYIQYKDVKKFQSTILASRLEYFLFDDYCNLNKLIKKIFNDVSSQIGLTFDFSTSCDHLDDPIENRILFKLTFRFLLELKTMRFNKYPWNGSKSLTLKADGDDMIDRVDPLVLIWGPWEEMLDENEVNHILKQYGYKSTISEKITKHVINLVHKRISDDLKDNFIDLENYINEIMNFHCALLQFKTYYGNDHLNILKKIFCIKKIVDSYFDGMKKRSMRNLGKIFSSSHYESLFSNDPTKCKTSLDIIVEKLVNNIEDLTG
ncbi:hypothetical protein DERP_005048 [Dermatophagoides pteronyssinus]|uniref:Uncharacterized protein n=1 Tax=Dermatophagoides pteronyssinus TaxID=6956 RepID=A0ABQ8JT69_DERPT|nr:hypothetical protein DERP_005048 [Dermatophagoides pteronyssinus]